VNETKPKTSRFDSDSDRRAADRYMFELRRNQRQETMRQTMRDNRFESSEPFDFERLRCGIQCNDFVELSE